LKSGYPDIRYLSRRAGLQVGLVQSLAGAKNFLAPRQAGKVRLVFAALLCTILFSISVICGHRSARLIGGTEANFWRVTVATFFLGIWAYGFGAGLSGDAFPVFLLSGIAGIGLGDVAFFQALPRVGPRLASLLVQCLTAPCAALIEWLWLGTTLAASQILCGLVILVGVGIALAPGEHMHLARRQLAIGTLASLIAALGGAGGAVFSRKAYVIVHANHQSIDPFSAGFQRLGGGLLIAGICLLFVKRGEIAQFARSANRRDPDSPTSAKWRRVWPWVLVNGLAGQTLGVSAMQWALETTPTGIVLAIIAMTPIVVIPFAILTEGERPTPRSLIGGLVAVGGVIGLTLSR
jgi:drug/metabolite transporter (DMT)-like permease